MLLTWPAVTGALVLLDTLALVAAFSTAYWIRFRSDLPIFREGADSVGFYSLLVMWALPIWIAIFAMWQLYDHRTLFSGYGEYARIGSACTAGALSIVLISYLYDTPNIARAWLLLVWLGSVMLIWGERFCVRRLVRRARTHGYLASRALVIGTNGEGDALAQQLMSDPGAGVQVVGFVEGSQPLEQTGAFSLPVVGSLTNLDARIADLGVDLLVIATGALARDEVLDLYGRFAHRQDVELRMSSGLFEILATSVRVQHAGCVPLMTIDRVRITGVDAMLKTLLDYTFALTALTILSPVLLLVAVAVKLDSGGPIFYRRRVVGRSGKTFDAFKFCTMVADRRKTSLPTTFPDRRRPDKSSLDPRITRFGRFLRKASIDEIPQLVNVLRGEMSLIGPRMVSPDELERYGKWQLNLLTVKPGITGPWQVRGRADISYHERVRLSTEYIRNYSIWLDIQILMQTVPAVVKGRGAY
ncbi:MAG: sugar transferase [Chloroflexi bacterium]|nr:sugar transferase [Chloroflexota bacterium]